MCCISTATWCVSAPACLFFGKGQTLTATDSSNISMRATANSLWIFIRANPSKWWRWLLAACVNDDRTRAQVRRPPEPLCTHHHDYPEDSICSISQWRESLQYLQLATHYHSWVCFRRALRLHPSSSSLSAPADIKDKQHHRKLFHRATFGNFNCVPPISWRCNRFCVSIHPCVHTLTLFVWRCWCYCPALQIRDPPSISFLSQKQQHIFISS